MTTYVMLTIALSVAEIEALAPLARAAGVPEEALVARYVRDGIERQRGAPIGSGKPKNHDLRIAPERCPACAVQRMQGAAIPKEATRW